MNGRCPQCERTIAVPVRKGDKISNYRCRRCDTTLQGVTAGRSSGRYLDPISGCVTTAELTGVRLTAPMRLVFCPGSDWSGRRSRPSPHEQEQLDRVAGRVLGPGCVVSRDFDPHRFDDAEQSFRDGQLARAGLRLVPADDPGEPGRWIVNGKLAYRKCVACGAQIADLPEHHVPWQWTPARDSRWIGHRHQYRQVPVRSGPHPAGSLACPECDPDRGARTPREAAARR